MDDSYHLSVWIIEINCIQQILWKSPKGVECTVYQDASEVNSTLLAAEQDCSFSTVYFRILKHMKNWEKNFQGACSFHVLPKLSGTSCIWETLTVGAGRGAPAHPGQNHGSRLSSGVYTPSALVRRLLSKPINKLECPVASLKPWFCSYLAIAPSHYLLLSNLMNEKPFPAPHLPHHSLPFRRSHPLLCSRLRLF